MDKDEKRELVSNLKKLMLILDTESKSKIITKIKVLISYDKIEESLKLIKKLAITDDQINFLILQTARFRELKEAINLNTIDWSGAQMEKSKIRKVLIEFLDELNAEIYRDQVFADNNMIENIVNKHSELINKIMTDTEQHKDAFAEIKNLFKNSDLEYLQDLSIVKLNDEKDIYNHGLECSSIKIEQNLFPRMVSTQLDEVDKKLLEFLTEYKEWYFSPTRIIRWGSNQKGYEIFTNLDVQDLENRLSKLYYRAALIRAIPKEGIKIYKKK